MMDSIIASSIDQYAQDLNDGGSKAIIGSPNTIWIRHEFFSMLRFPTFYLDVPTLLEIKALWNERVALASYLIKPDLSHRANSFLYTCEDNSYNLNKLSDKTKSDIRRATRELKIAFIDWPTLMKEGFPSFRDTRSRVGLSDGTFNNFKSWYEYLSKIKAHYVVGARKEDRLVAYMCLTVVNDSIEVGDFCSTTEYRHHRPNNGLLYFIIDYFLVLKKFKIISYGVSSIQPETDKTGLHRFKTKMGFQARPVHRVFVFNPLLKPFINKFSLHSLKLLLKLNAKNRKLKKCIGVFESVFNKEEIIDSDERELSDEG